MVVLDKSFMIFPRNPRWIWDGEGELPHLSGGNSEGVGMVPKYSCKKTYKLKTRTIITYGILSLANQNVIFLQLSPHIYYVNKFFKGAEILC